MARDTDLNIIVEKFKITGAYPAPNSNPSRATSPTSRTTSGIHRNRKKHQGLPRQAAPATAGNAIEQLLALTPDALTNILTPPAPKPAD